MHEEKPFSTISVRVAFRRRMKRLAAEQDRPMYLILEEMLNKQYPARDAQSEMEPAHAHN